MIHPGTTQTLFLFNAGPQPAGPQPAVFVGVLNPGSGYLAGGIIPLSTGVLNTFSLYQQAPGEIINSGWGDVGGFVSQGVQGANFYQGTGQVIHLAATGKFAGLTANST